MFPSDAIRILREEVGYHEKKSNKDLDSKTANSGSLNWTKYARDLDAINYFNGKKNGPVGEWCAILQCWVQYKLYGDGLSARAALYQPDAKYNCGAGCTWQAGYFRENNAFSKSPQPGDWIFYGVPGDEYHTGGVVEVSGKTVYTIEGNVDNQVLLCAHDINDPSIAGYGRPKYQKNDPCAVYVVKPNDTLNKIADMFDVKAEDIAKENNIPDPNLINVGQVLIFKKGPKEWHTTDIFCQFGDRNKAVSMLQGLLLKRGLSLTYDGYFGAETRSAVMAWQNSKGITVDGIVGDETLGTL